MSNKIEQLSSARIANDQTIARQTPKRDFGDRLKAGIDATASVVGQGASIIGGAIPGGAVLSAAVSNVSGGMSAISGSSSPAVSTQYMGAAGALPVGESGGFTGGIGGSSGGAGGTYQDIVAKAGSLNDKEAMAYMLQVQMQMQHENQMYSSMSNVLKTRHDTVKNSISNIR